MTENQLQHFLMHLMSHPQVQQVLKEMLEGRPMPPQIVIISQPLRIDSEQLSFILAKAMSGTAWMPPRPPPVESLAQAIQRTWDW